MAPNQLASGNIGPRGIDGDRRWLVIDAQDRFITGRRLPELVLCCASETANALTLTKHAARIDVPVPNATAKVREVVIWKDTVPALDAGDAASDWLSEQFGTPLRLVYQANSQHRWLAEGKALHRDDEVSFADGYPLLLIGTASLDALNARLNVPVTMAHFRPNLVVHTDAPFVEDAWQSVRVGSVIFDIASQCSRCIFTTVDPATGERRTDREPLTTLSTYRRDAETRNILFGVNAIPRNTGVVAVNDTVVPTLQPQS